MKRFRRQRKLDFIMIILFVRCLHIFISEHILFSRVTLILAKERREKKKRKKKRNEEPRPQSWLNKIIATDNVIYGVTSWAKLCLFYFVHKRLKWVLLVCLFVFFKAICGSPFLAHCIIIIILANIYIYLITYRVHLTGCTLFRATSLRRA